jgi:hypothetical protein
VEAAEETEVPATDPAAVEAEEQELVAFVGGSAATNDTDSAGM